MPNFHVGQKVVCVDVTSVTPGTGAWYPTCDLPQEGRVYTVRSVGEILGIPSIKLNEITWRGFTHGVFDDDGFYSAFRFRPVVERKTDISIFKKILAGTRQPEGVEA